MTTVAAGCWARNGRNSFRFSRRAFSVLPGRRDTMTSNTAFARSTAIRVWLLTMGSSIGLATTTLALDTDPVEEESISSMQLTKLDEHLVGGRSAHVRCRRPI